ncbi:MAG: hypothetical protein IPG55_05765 [Saprospiraceae bacterium]|jgi:hypothetical protein|nr:hypothetical protein [Candidatus Defluviibacterium haderslevense]MBK7245256.1 hypothetical protein [Candidatus Defluviibacterium haderslevense]
MHELIIGTIIISLMHAIIPSHWLPILTISKTHHWSNFETIRVTFLLGFAHVISTILIGAVLGLMAYGLQVQVPAFTSKLGPIVLIILGLYFIYRHHTHHHFHVDDDLIEGPIKKRQLILSLMMFMILSPCSEILAFFFKAGSESIQLFILIALIYSSITILGMLLWINMALHGLKKINWHPIEHYAGLITGITILITGLISFFTN